MNYRSYKIYFIVPVCQIFTSFCFVSFSQQCIYANLNLDIELSDFFSTYHDTTQAAWFHIQVGQEKIHYYINVKELKPGRLQTWKVFSDSFHQN